jgi:O-6-methylguanine DNA methyltransferase
MVLLARDTPFARRVFVAVRRIPPGCLATYGDIAAAAGRPRAWRAVGNIMRGCSDRSVPCHRVIGAGGRLGGYGSNPALKAALLRAEGLVVAGDRIRNWREHRVAAVKRDPAGRGRQDPLRRP